MSVESNISFVAELNELYPRKNDLIKEGDDHIRLVKRVLKSTFPGFKNAVSITSDKLNLVDQTIEIDSQGLTINKPLKMGPKATINLSGNKLTGLPEPTEDADPITLKYIKKLVQDTVWPISSLYFTLSDKNPRDLIGYGTWEIYGAGRAIVGVGTSVDANGTSRTFSLGEFGGNHSVSIGKNNLPDYQLAGTLKIDEGGEHSHTFQQLQIAGPSPDTKHGSPIAQYGMTTYTTDSAGKHSHTGSLTVNLGGAGERLTVVQPYVAVNIWRRTA